MLGQNHFYHETIRRTVIAFGSVFNDIHVRRKDASSTVHTVHEEYHYHMVLNRNFLLDYMRTQT